MDYNIALTDASMENFGSPSSSFSSSFGSPGGSPTAGYSRPGMQHPQQTSLQPPTATQQGGGLQLSRPPSPSTSTSSGNSTFVYKLFQILAEEDESLIKWGPDGTTFVARDSHDLREHVFSKYFKHKSFESFVRQLNMYGFHKVNKQSRGQRGAENQIYEFKHPSFQRGREDLLEEIRRKPHDHTENRRDGSSNHGQNGGGDVVMAQVLQQLKHQVDDIQQQLHIVQRELNMTRRREQEQEQCIRSIIGFLQQHHGAQLQPPSGQGLDLGGPPPIVVSSHDADPSSHMNLDPMPSARRMTRLTVQTDNLSHPAQGGSPLSSPSSSVHHSPVSPGNDLYTAMNTPLPPSPNPGVFPDDEGASVGSYQSPNGSSMGDTVTFFTAPQEHNQQMVFSNLWQGQQQAMMMDPQAMAMMQEHHHQQQQQQLHQFPGTNM